MICNDRQAGGAPFWKTVLQTAMDNLGSHKGAAINKTIRKRGARRFFLPQYSPDLNPIEQVFAKLKTLLCKSEQRTAEGAWKTIGALLSTLSADECAAYLRNSD